MNAATEAKMNEMIAYAKKGNMIYPMFWQPTFGRSNTVSAAIRAAKKANLLEVAGLDGCGKPYYRAVIPAATHVVSNTVN